MPNLRSSRRIFLAAAILLAIVLGYNLLIHISARKSQRGRLLAALERIPPETECIFLGNSLVEAGCDLAAFQAAWPNGGAAPRSVNLALGATSPVEHSLILSRALQRPLHLKYLIYGFFDDQLNTLPRGQWSDLVGNRALSYYFPAEAAAYYAPGSRLERWELEVVGHIPMLAERSALWSKVELLRRRLEDIGMPKHKTNRFGRVDDFSGLEAADLASFKQRCEKVLAGRGEFSPAVQHLIRLAREHGAQVILVEMPMPSKHRQVFYASTAWQRLRACLQTQAREENAIYLTAADWLTDDGNFEDATHLNEQGASRFSRMLATEIARLSPGSGLFGTPTASNGSAASQRQDHVPH